MAELLEENIGAQAVDDNPAEIPGVDSAAATPKYGKNNVELPERLVNAWKKVVSEFKNQEMYDRRREVMRDRRNRFYERGNQHVYADERSGFFSAGAAGTVISVNGKEMACPDYMFDWNIFTPSLDTIVAVMTQNPPGVNFKASQPDEVEDQEAAEAAEGYRTIYDRNNDTRELWTKTVRMFGLSGRCVGWTHSEADEQKYGLNQQGQPRSVQTTEIFGTLESKISVFSRDLSECPYCFLFKDYDIKVAKTKHPDFKDKIKRGEPSIAESIYERTARLGVLQGSRAQMQTGDVLQHLSTEAHCIVRPSAFVDLSDDLKAEMNELYPEGGHAVFVGEVYCGSWAESMDESVTVAFPYEGDGMDRRAIMDPAVTIQDSFNDAMNGTRSLFDHVWPALWVSCTETEYDAILSQKALPGAIRQLKAGAGAQLAHSFFREPDPQLSPSFIQYVENIQGPLLEFILGTPPALWGGAAEGAGGQTAAGYAQARAQAMGRLGLIWGNLQKFAARVYYQAALCASADPDSSKTITVPGGDGTNTAVHLERLQKNHFGAYPDQDSSFPETTAAQRAILSQLFTMAAQTQLGSEIFESPKNWELVKNAMGTPDVFIQQVESGRKQRFEIELLLRTEPIQPSEEIVAAAEQKHAADAIVARQQAAANGMPPPADQPFDPSSLIQPSIPVDPIMDFNAFEFAEGREWYSSDARRNEQETNPLGVENVRLHLLQHMKAMALDAAMNPQPAPVPAKGGKPTPPMPKGQQAKATPPGVAAPAPVQ